MLGLLHGTANNTSKRDLYDFKTKAKIISRCSSFCSSGSMISFLFMSNKHRPQRICFFSCELAMSSLFTSTDSPWSDASVTVRIQGTGS